MIVDVLVAAFGLMALAGVYLTLAPADREPGDCGSCALKEDPTLCGGCGLPETPPPGADPLADAGADLDGWRAGRAGRAGTGDAWTRNGDHGRREERP